MKRECRAAVATYRPGPLAAGRNHRAWCKEMKWAARGWNNRADRMSTAVNNTSGEREFTVRYEALLRDYRMAGPGDSRRAKPTSTVMKTATLSSEGCLGPMAVSAGRA